MGDWITIRTKFSTKCIQCNEWIMRGRTAQWKEGMGLKCHPECRNTGILKEDKTQLITYDQEEDFYLK